MVNEIHNHNSNSMHELSDNEVQLVVTSPPYNVGKEYEQETSYHEWKNEMDEIWHECYRVLTGGCYICVNVAAIGRNPYNPLQAWIWEGLIEAGFTPRGEIIWNKAASVGESTAWGSYLSPSSPCIRDVHEYILLARKGDAKREPPEDQRKKTFLGEGGPAKFMELTKSIWTFSTESARRVGHPAPFPIELPKRCIELYTWPGETVLDPFMGSGTTAVAAQNMCRNYVGYDIHQQYIDIAEKRLRQVRLL